jgi:hypothetical protein
MAELIDSDANNDLRQLRKYRGALLSAIEHGCSDKWILRLWSRFIRFRDQGCCLNCKSQKHIQAHHVVRKVLYHWGAFETGNGISLCRDCHRTIHAQFNSRPNFRLPIGAENGDDQDEWAFLYGLLLDDAQSRGLPEDEFYFIGKHMLLFFVRCQGYEELLELVEEGTLSRIRFAHEIWRIMPESFYANDILEIVFENSLFA